MLLTSQSVGASPLSFRTLWITWTLSLLGIQFFSIGTPLLAAVVMHASPFEIGILAAVRVLPNTLMAPFAGGFVDRLPNKPLALAMCDFLCAAFVVLIPLSAFLGQLNISVLAAVSFGLGAVSVISSPLHQIVLGSIVGKDGLVRANSWLFGSVSATDILGALLVSLVITVVPVPYALLINVATYVVSGAILMTFLKIEHSDPAHVPSQVGQRENFLTGLKRLFGTDMRLRRLTIFLITWTFLFNAYSALAVLHADRVLQLAAKDISASFMFSGLGGATAAWISAKTIKRISATSVILFAPLFCAIAWLILALAPNTGFNRLPVWMACLALFSFGFTLFSIALTSARQRIVKSGELGRVTASSRFLTFGVAAPLGSFASGAAAVKLGTTPVIISISIFLLLTILFFSTHRITFED